MIGDILSLDVQTSPGLFYLIRQRRWQRETDLF